MKTPQVIGLVVVSVLITVAIQEARIKSLRQALQTAETPTAAPAVVAAASKPADESLPAPVRTKNSTEAERKAPAKETESNEESFAKTARKMWDNPAGKSMMNQGVKIAVAMMYQDFIDGLNLSKEEGDYLKNLLGKEMSDQQELGMKMLGASPAELTSLTDEMKKRGEDNEAEIKKFLNNDEDVKAYETYKNHLPERQQLDGIRSVMSAKGAPLDAETETKLVDAMYRARTESKAPDLSGPAGIEAFSKGNMVETFEKSWDAQQEKLRSETTGILSDSQMEAFQDYQKQAKEMQLMGLKMAEKMMPGMKDKGE